MSRHWEAPRLAYELAAEWAEKAREGLARDRGGALGQPIGAIQATPGIGKQWHDLRTLEQHDVLEALGTQVRAALFEARKYHGFSEREAIVIDLGAYSTRMCEQAREVLPALTDPSGTRPWKMPECSHCAALAAETLIGIHAGAIMLTGVPDPAAVLRNLAASVTVPGQREAGNA